MIAYAFIFRNRSWKNQSRTQFQLNHKKEKKKRKTNTKQNRTLDIFFYLNAECYYEEKKNTTHVLAAIYRSKILITEQQQQLLKKIRNHYNMNCFSFESHSLTNGLNHNIVHMNRVCIPWPSMNISSVECCPKMR